MHPKNVINAGSALRACGNFGGSLLLLQGRRFKAAPSDTMKMWRHIPVMDVADMRAALPYGCVPVAVERVGASCTLPNYKHPERALYIFGPEDSSLGHETLEWCRDVVSVPTEGSMNLATCVSVVLYDRLSKLLK